MREVDQNTRFFHNFACGRKKNNQISKLRNKDGEWVESVQGVQDIITDYFSELFTSSMTARALSDREKVNRVREKVNCVTEEQNAQLGKPILNEEVKEAVFYMHIEKAP